MCGLITPWNWPINQIACKVAPALAAGCTMVLKPTEIAPLNAILFAEILHAAGVPAGVFNLVNGDGPTVGQAIAEHPGVDMVSFTGSTRAGIEVARAAAPTVKRVAQELGGKSANIILDDADFAAAVGGGTMGCAMNSGQSCNAPTRMLVPRSRHDEAVAIAKATAESITVGDPVGGDDADRAGRERGAVEQDPGPDPEGHRRGRHARDRRPGPPRGPRRAATTCGRPCSRTCATTCRSRARRSSGPCSRSCPTRTRRTRSGSPTTRVRPRGLCVVGQPRARAPRRLADPRRPDQRERGPPDFGAPFGGYKQSGNGREWGEFGFEEFLETKAVIGWGEVRAVTSTTACAARARSSGSSARARATSPP